ncbi:MAG: DNA repair exonuclease [Thaumarchaeota archaeon]|nr:DNA repair exonuclease [Nitrososphaerota archaeon]
MTLIAHIADVHLGYSQYGLSEREEDVYEAFEEAVELIRREHVDLLLIAGDLFDSPRPPIRALMKARDLLSQLKDQGIEIYHVIGDHEIPRRVGDLPPTAILEGVSKHIGLRNVEAINGITLTGLDRVKPSMSSEAFGKLRLMAEDSRKRGGKRILVSHIPLRGPESGLSKLPEGYGYYALGHEHERKIFSIKGSVAAYSGSIEIFSVSELEAWEKAGKGFILVDFSGSEPITHEVNLDSIRPQRLFTAKVEELMKVLEEAERWSLAQRKKPIVHFRIVGKSMDRMEVARRIQEKLSGKTLHHRYEVIEEAEKIERIEEVSRIDLRSILAEYMSAKGLSKAEVELTLSIYEAYVSRGAEEVERFILRRAEEIERL